MVEHWGKTEGRGGQSLVTVGCHSAHSLRGGGETVVRPEANRELCGEDPDRKRGDGTSWEGHTLSSLSLLPASGPQRPASIVVHWHSQPPQAQDRWTG